MARLLFLLLTIIIWAKPLLAQISVRQAPVDSVTNAFVPVFGYSSNEGFIGGGVYNRYDYRGNIKPFRSYLESSALISTKGYFKIEGRYEQTRSYGRNIRSVYNLFFRRFTSDHFFGIGNNTMFYENRWENGYYYYESISLGLNYKARKPIFSDDDSQLDVFAGAGTEYHIPYANSEQTAFAQQMPNGSEGGWVNFLNSGLIWENRDSEFDPHHGNRIELELRFSPRLISNYALTTARLELRQYFYLFNWLTIANRLEARHAAGNVPFWEMSVLGDDNTLRGYPLNRFQGNSSIAYTLELRGWLIEFPQFYNLKFGGQLFTDTGRVFTPGDDFNSLFEDYKQTFGFGGAMSIFNPDFILRSDVGFSEDMMQIYIGIGYLF